MACDYHSCNSPPPDK